MSNLRKLRFHVAAWVCLLGWCVSPASAETLAEKTLLDITERQNDIFAKAAKEGDQVDQAWLRGELQSVIKSYDILIQKNPDYALAYAGYGLLLGKVGMNKEAVVMLLKANKLDHTMAQVKNQIAVLLAEDGKPVDALPWVTAAIDQEPGKAVYHYQLGELLSGGRADFLHADLFTAPKLDQAILDAFKRAAELLPADYAVAYRRGKAYYELDAPRWAEALEVWKKAEALAANDTQRQLVRLQRANVLLKLARRAEGRSLLDTVTDLSLSAEKQTLLDEFAKAGEK